MRTTTVAAPRRVLTAAQLRELRRDLEREQSRFTPQDPRLDPYVEALRRMHDGTYGACIRCDEPISYDRLAVMPETPVCIGCRGQP